MNTAVRFAVLGVLLSAAATADAACAANPYLDAKDNSPHSVLMTGKEWGDGRGGPDTGGESVPFKAKVVTTRLATAPWGALYKISYEKACKSSRTIQPDYFIVTDKNISLLNEEDNVKAVQRLAAQTESPKCEQDDLRAIDSGVKQFVSGSWTTKISVKGDSCTYDSSHPSGHYATMVFKRGAGLVSTSSNYGAAADGYALRVQQANGTRRR